MGRRNWLNRSTARMRRARNRAAYAEQELALAKTNAAVFIKMLANERDMWRGLAEHRAVLLRERGDHAEGDGVLEAR